MSSFRILVLKAVCQCDTRQDCNECTQRIFDFDQSGRALHYFMYRVCFVMCEIALLVWSIIHVNSCSLFS